MASKSGRSLWNVTLDACLITPILPMLLDGGITTIAVMVDGASQRSDDDSGCKANENPAPLGGAGVKMSGPLTVVAPTVACTVPQPAVLGADCTWNVAECAPSGTAIRL